MKEKNQPREVKFPENKKIAKKLNPGDRVVIASYAELSPGTIRDMLNGFRRITHKAGLAIIHFFEERDNVKKTLEEIANQD